MLKLWAELGLICLKYLDESGFERSSPLNYTYAQRGVHKRIRQPRKRGRRISTLGLWEPGRGFEYGLVVGGFNSNRYIALMTWQEQGLLIFFLPPYSPQMNRIEDEWLHLKREEFATRLFDDEYDLVIAVIDAIEHRANVGNYTVERFRFNCV